MPRVEDYISKKNVRRWLENYVSLEAGDQLPDALPVNSGPKAYDGVTGGRLNKIMLDQAIAQLSPFMQAVVKCRWTRRRSLKDTLRLLGVSKDIYYQRCDQAVEQIYRNINGMAVGVADIYTKIDKT